VLAKAGSSRFRSSQSLPSCLYGPEASGAARGGSETWWQRVAPFPVAETSVRKVTPLLVFVPRFGSANWVLNSWSQGRCFSFARDSETVPAGTLGRSESQRRAIDACVPLSATLSPSIDFPLTRLYDLVCSSDFLAGASRASPVAWHVLVTVLSLSPRRDQDAASVRFRHPMLPSPFFCGLGSRIHLLSRPVRVHYHYGPVTSNLPKGGWASESRFPSTLHPRYGASDFCPGKV
jgi:hypothetical protein